MNQVDWNALDDLIDRIRQLEIPASERAELVKENLTDGSWAEVEEWVAAILAD